MGAALGEVGRRQQDRGPAGGRPVVVAVEDRHPAAVTRLVERAVGAADEHRGHLPRRDVRLDLDEMADSAVERPPCASLRTACQASPSTWSTIEAPRRGRSTATRSTRTSSGRTSCSSAHRHTSRCSRSQPDRVDGLVRRPAPVAAPGLDLAGDQHVAVAQHQVELALGASPVAVEDDQPLVRQVGRRHPFAVGPESLPLRCRRRHVDLLGGGFTAAPSAGRVPAPSCGERRIRASPVDAYRTTVLTG